MTTLSLPDAGTVRTLPLHPATDYLLVDRVARQLWRAREPGVDTPIAVLEVVPLDRTDGRVSDSSRASGDDSRLLGYIERLGRDAYEVLWFAPSLGWLSVSSFPHALAALAGRDRFAGLIGATRRPPLEGRRRILAKEV